MANFDTHGENATIMYADDGEKFVMEWRNLQLREQRSGTVSVHFLRLRLLHFANFLFENLTLKSDNSKNIAARIKWTMFVSFEEVNIIGKCCKYASFLVFSNYI